MKNETIPNEYCIPVRSFSNGTDQYAIYIPEDLSFAICTCPNFWRMNGNKDVYDMEACKHIEVVVSSIKIGMETMKSFQNVIDNFQSKNDIQNVLK